ncbi:MAG: hypothetical protein AAFN10_00960 [Bacteroidota bacterium]
MRLSFIYLCIGILAFGGQPQLLKGQENTINPKWSLQFNAQHQDVLLRYDIGLLGVTHEVKIRPAFSLEAQRYFKVKAKSRLFASGQLGHYRNLYHERWNSLQLGLGWERTLFAGLFLNLRINAGVAHTRNADPQYIYENGEWVPTKTAAQQYVDLVMGPRLDLGYRIPTQGNPIDIIATTSGILHYNKILEFLYPHYGLGLGVRYSW